MSTLLGSFFVDVKSNTNQVERDFKRLKRVGNNVVSSIGKSSSHGFSKLGHGIGNLFKKGLKAGAAGSVAALTVVAKKAFDEIADYQQNVGGVETMFGGDNAKKVLENAKNAYAESQISANNYMEQVTSFSASLIQSLGGDQKKAVDKADTAIKDMSDNANKLGTDVEFIQRAYQGFAKGNFTMLDNLKLGFGGTKGEMQRLLDKAGELSGRKFSIDNFADMVDAIHIIQDDLKITGTSMQEANTTIEGSLNALKASWKNWLTGLGDKDADKSDLTKKLVDRAKIFGKNSIPIIKEIIKGIGTAIKEESKNIFAGAGNFLVENIPEFINTFVSLVDGFRSAVRDLLPSAKELLANLLADFRENGPTFIMDAFQFIFDVLPDLLDMLTDIIITVIDVMTQIFTNPESREKLFQGFIQLLSSAFTNIGRILEHLIPYIIEVVGFIVDKLAEILGSLFGTIGEKIGGYLGLDVGKIGGATRQIDYGNSAMGGLQNQNAQLARQGGVINTQVNLDGRTIAKSTNKYNKNDKRGRG